MRIISIINLKGGVGKTVTSAIPEKLEHQIRTYNCLLDALDLLKETLAAEYAPQ